MKTLGLGMHRKTKGIRVLCLLLLTLLMTGCLGVKDQLTAESVYTYETMQSEDKSKEFYIEQTAYYQDRVVITWGGTIDLSKFARMEPACELDGNTIVIFSDAPETVTTFTVMDKYEETQYHFRYLNSEAYAYLKRTMDSEGGIYFDGNPDRYYTAEEKAAQEEAKRKRQERQDALFERLQGTWVSESGNYFTISRDEDVCLEYSVDGKWEKIDGIRLEDNFRALENNIAMMYYEGPFSAVIDVMPAEDGRSFAYGKEVFERLENEFFRASLSYRLQEKADDGYGNVRDILTLTFTFTNITQQTYYKNNDEEIAPGAAWQKTITDPTERWEKFAGENNWIHYALFDEERKEIFDGGLKFVVDEAFRVRDMELFESTGQ